MDRQTTTHVVRPHVNLITGRVAVSFFLWSEGGIEMSQNIGLGTERISRLLRAFALPCIFSLIVSCLYNIVDQIFVGNGIGYLGNDTTGIIFPVTVVGWGVSLLFGDGAAAYLSVCAGKNDKEAIPGAVANSIVGALLGGLLIALLGYCLGDQLLYGLGMEACSRALFEMKKRETHLAFLVDFINELLGIVPAQARVGDRFSGHHVFAYILTSFFQIAFDHQAFD